MAGEAGRGIFVDLSPAGLPPGAGNGERGPGRGREGVQLSGEPGGAGAQDQELSSLVIEFGQVGPWGLGQQT
ncbi:MAG: hypothetical protein ACYDD0_11720 [Candidatus Dormibacteria bacterium]